MTDYPLILSNFAEGSWDYEDVTIADTTPAIYTVLTYNVSVGTITGNVTGSTYPSSAFTSVVKRDGVAVGTLNGSGSMVDTVPAEGDYTYTFELSWVYPETPEAGSKEGTVYTGTQEVSVILDVIEILSVEGTLDSGPQIVTLDMSRYIALGRPLPGCADYPWYQVGGALTGTSFIDAYHKETITGNDTSLYTSFTVFGVNQSASRSQTMSDLGYGTQLEEYHWVNSTTLRTSLNGTNDSGGSNTVEAGEYLRYVDRTFSTEAENCPI